MLCCNSSLLTIPVLGSPESEWLWCLAILALQPTNMSDLGSSGSKSLWCFTAILLIIPVLDSSDGEWLSCLAMILAC